MEKYVKKKNYKLQLTVLLLQEKVLLPKKIARRFAYIYCDTGAMYRTVTLKAMQTGVALDDAQALAKMLAKTDITFKPGDPEQLVFLDGQEVTMAIRQPDVTNNVSTVAAQALLEPI